jgi:hypothetical protein
VKPNVRKDERKRLRAMLYKCRAKGAEVHDKTHIRGKIAHFQSVNPELGTRFLKEFDSIQWPTQL